jgi:hypothetical protein
VNLATWNVRGLAHEVDELESEPKRIKIDISIVSETKGKLKGTTDLKDYIPNLRVYKPHLFDKNLPSKIGVRLIDGISFFKRT